MDAERNTSTKVAQKVMRKSLRLLVWISTFSCEIAGQTVFILTFTLLPPLWCDDWPQIDFSLNFDKLAQSLKPQKQQEFASKLSTYTLFAGAAAGKLSG